MAAIRGTRQHLKPSKDQTDLSVPHRDGPGLVKFSNERKKKVAIEVLSLDNLLKEFLLL